MTLLFFGQVLSASEPDIAVYKINSVIDNAPSSFPTSFTEYHNKLYFVATDNEYGRELWRYDVVTNQSELVNDIRIGYSDSLIGYFKNEYRHR